MNNRVESTDRVDSKKRLLFVIPSFAIGGITSSLRSLLTVIDYSKVEVDVFCRKKSGPLKDAFPKARILPENIWLSSAIVEGDLVNRMLFKIIKSIRVALRLIGVDLNKVYGRIGGGQIRTTLYDAIISFHEGLSPIVCYYPGKKHIAWIHSDYRRYLSAVKKDERKQYELFDSIVCVSDFARSIFVGLFPSLADKTKAIHNIIPVEEIVLESEDITNMDAKFRTDKYTIVSVGRLDPVKQFDRIPAIAAEIKKFTTIPFRWYIIGGERGYGEVDTFMSEIIKDNNVDLDVILLGEKRNVYPYIRQADLYVCTSESESFPLAVNEAKALGVPIVSNSFPSVKESLRDNIDGRIVTLENMPIVISDIMNNRVSFRGGQIDNDTPLRQFYELIGIVEYNF